MSIVHIEHTVLEYKRWKAAFDGDPVGRRQAGVRRYRIARAADDPNLVMIDLELDSMPEAEDLLASLRQLWDRVTGVLVESPRGRIFEVAEQQDL